MTGKTLRIPDDIASTTQYMVESEGACEGARKAIAGLTLGTAVARIGRWHEDVRAEIQMPIPRQPPWQQRPVLILRARALDMPPRPERKPTEPEGDDRPGWVRRTSTSYLLKAKGQIVYLDDEGWHGTWLGGEKPFPKLWQAQKFVEDHADDPLPPADKNGIVQVPVQKRRRTKILRERVDLCPWCNSQDRERPRSLCEDPDGTLLLICLTCFRKDPAPAGMSHV